MKRVGFKLAAIYVLLNKKKSPGPNFVHAILRLQRKCYVTFTAMNARMLWELHYNIPTMLWGFHYNISKMLWDLHYNISTMLWESSLQYLYNVMESSLSLRKKKDPWMGDFK